MNKHLPILHTFGAILPPREKPQKGPYWANGLMHMEVGQDDVL